MFLHVIVVVKDGHLIGVLLLFDVVNLRFLLLLMGFLILLFLFWLRFFILFFFFNYWVFQLFRIFFAFWQQMLKTFGILVFYLNFVFVIFNQSIWEVVFKISVRYEKLTDRFLRFDFEEESLPWIFDVFLKWFGAEYIEDFSMQRFMRLLWGHWKN